MTHSKNRRIKFGSGDQLLIDSPKQIPSRYAIEAPNIWFGWDFARDIMKEAGIPDLPDDIVLLNSRSPLNLRRAADQLACYFQRQFGYDFQQYQANNPSGIVFLWSNGRIDQDRLAIGAVHFMQRAEENGSHYWKLNWAWFHPYERRKGLLRSIWPYFEKRFGRFHVGTPVSPEMMQFLSSIGCADWHNIPEGTENSGDWFNYQDKLDTIQEPKGYSLSDQDILDDAGETEQDDISEDFFNFLLQQFERDDPIGDIAKQAYADPEWPTRGGLKTIWKYLIDRGFWHNGFQALLMAWAEHAGDFVDVPLDTHSKVSRILFDIEDDLLLASNLLSKTTGSASSSMRHMRRASQVIRTELRETLLGKDRDIYMNKPNLPK